MPIRRRRMRGAKTPLSISLHLFGWLQRLTRKAAILGSQATLCIPFQGPASPRIFPANLRAAEKFSALSRGEGLHFQMPFYFPLGFSFLDNLSLIHFLSVFCNSNFNLDFTPHTIQAQGYGSQVPLGKFSDKPRELFFLHEYFARPRVVIVGRGVFWLPRRNRGVGQKRFSCF